MDYWIAHRKPSNKRAYQRFTKDFSHNGFVLAHSTWFNL